MFQGPSTLGFILSSIPNGGVSGGSVNVDGRAVRAHYRRRGAHAESE
jgi:hypothetical protein